MCIRTCSGTLCQRAYVLVSCLCSRDCHIAHFHELSVEYSGYGDVIFLAQYGNDAEVLIADISFDEQDEIPSGKGVWQARW